jgi:hypothetical protein
MYSAEGQDTSQRAPGKSTGGIGGIVSAFLVLGIGIVVIVTVVGVGVGSSTSVGARTRIITLTIPSLLSLPNTRNHLSPSPAPLAPPLPPELTPQLGTSDKDFAGRDRLGEGAYADTHGAFSSNTTGPKGNTALTGREGNVEKNPVAQAQSTDPGVGARSAGAPVGAGAGTRGDTQSQSHAATAGEKEGEHKGLMDKVKDVFKS